MWTILIITAVVVLVILSVIALLFLLLYYAVKSDTPEAQLEEFGVNLLGYKFDDKYESVELIPRNQHRPQMLKIKLSDDDLQRLKVHIDTLSEGEEKTERDNIAYIRSISKRENGCSSQYFSIDLSCDYVFFSASAEIDYPSKTVLFHSIDY